MSAPMVAAVFATDDPGGVALRAGQLPEHPGSPATVAGGAVMERTVALCTSHGQYLSVEPR